VQNRLQCRAGKHSKLMPTFLRMDVSKATQERTNTDVTTWPARGKTAGSRHTERLRNGTFRLHLYSKPAVVRQGRRMWEVGACGLWRGADLGDSVSLAADEPRPVLFGMLSLVGLLEVGRIAVFMASYAGCFWAVAACGCW